MKIPELLAPAGNMEKALRPLSTVPMLCTCGPAVWHAGPGGNFSLAEIREILRVAHKGCEGICNCEHLSSQS